MIQNFIFVVVLICVIFFFYQLNLKKNETFIDETFIDKNFKLENKKMSEEKSIRFSQRLPFNNDRVVYGFQDIDYFYNNRHNIFNSYGINNKNLMDYFEGKYRLTKEIPQNTKLLPNNNIGTYEIGIGVDRKYGVGKIYFLINNAIYSLKLKKNGEFVESIYNETRKVNNNEVKRYLGENRYNIINNNIKLLSIPEFSSFEEYINNMVNFSKKINQDIDISSIRNIFDRELKNKYKPTSKKINSLRCFVRYDNGKLSGYNYDISEKKLYVKDSKPFLVKLLRELNCNIFNIDSWIKQYGNYVISYISFVNVNNDLNVTIYYNNNY